MSDDMLANTSLVSNLLANTTNMFPNELLKCNNYKMILYEYMQWKNISMKL